MIVVRFRREGPSRRPETHLGQPGVQGAPIGDRQHIARSSNSLSCGRASRRSAVEFQPSGQLARPTAEARERLPSPDATQPLPRPQTSPAPPLRAAPLARPDAIELSLSARRAVPPRAGMPQRRTLRWPDRTNAGTLAGTPPDGGFRNERPGSASYRAATRTRRGARRTLLRGDPPAGFRDDVPRLRDAGGDRRPERRRPAGRSRTATSRRWRATSTSSR